MLFLTSNWNSFILLLVMVQTSLVQVVLHILLYSQTVTSQPYSKIEGNSRKFSDIEVQHVGNSVSTAVKFF